MIGKPLLLEVRSDLEPPNGPDFYYYFNGYRLPWEDT
jgi:hypothetical protein